MNPAGDGEDEGAWRSPPGVEAARRAPYAQKCPAGQTPSTRAIPARCASGTMGTAGTSGPPTSATDHQYMVVIRLSPDAGFTDVHPVRDEKDDKVTLGETTRSTTTSTRSPRSTAPTSWSSIRAKARCAVEHERLTFHTMFDGQPVATRMRPDRRHQGNPGPQPSPSLVSL